MTIQTGIDGYRLIADRTGLYAGNDDAIYEGKDDSHPIKATVTVRKIVHGEARAFTASARWSEYAQSFNGKPADMWKKFPYLMLAKCAEALALRKAFPQELSGLYTHEEMQQADVIDTPSFLPVDTGEEEALRKSIAAVFAAQGVSEDKIAAWWHRQHERFGNELTTAVLRELLGQLQAAAKKKIVERTEEVFGAKVIEVQKPMWRVSLEANKDEFLSLVFDDDSLEASHLCKALDAALRGDMADGEAHATCEAILTYIERHKQ